jgi:hypothetical protein
MSSLKKVYQTYRTAMIVGAAIGGALVFYVVLVEIFKSARAPVDPLDDRSRYDLLRIIFYALSLGQFLMIGFVRGLILRTPSAEPVDALLAKLARANIVTLALCELPALLGLVLFFLAGFISDFYLLFGVSMLMLFFYFPRYNKWKNWVRDKAGSHWDSNHGPGT